MGDEKKLLINEQPIWGRGGGWVVKTNWQNLLGGLIKFLSWHNWSPLTLPSHPTQATDDDRSLKKVRECRAGVGFSEPAYVNLCGCALIGFHCRFLSDCTRDAARVIWKDLYLLLSWPSALLAPFSVIKSIVLSLGCYFIFNCICKTYSHINKSIKNNNNDNNSENCR